MVIPDTYAHKATSESFNGRTGVSVYYSRAFDNYFILIRGTDLDNEVGLYFTKTELELMIHAAKDTLDDQRV